MLKDEVWWTGEDVEVEDEDENNEFLENVSYILDYYDCDRDYLKEDLTHLFLDFMDKQKHYKKEKEKEPTKNMFNFNNMFDGMFKPVAAGMCKMGMNGKIAIKTSTGYKTFDIKKNRLVNCDSFAFDMDNMFWIVPTFKVEKGDIIIVNGKPRAVIEIGENTIKTFTYEDSTIVETVPEHHVFMGKTYCYGKIFSPFMNMTKDDGLKDMMKMMMMGKMFNGDTSMNMNGMNPMMFMMMGKDNPFENMFNGAFDFGFDAVEEDIKED